MHKEIEALSEQITQHCEEIGRYDEALVNLAIALGRALERNGIDAFRLKVFEDFEASNKAYEIKFGPVTAISNSLLTIVQSALAEQILRDGSFYLGKSDNWSHPSVLDADIVSKFMINIQRSSYSKSDDCLWTACEAVDELADVLESFGLRTNFIFLSVDVDEQSEDKILTSVMSIPDVCEVRPLFHPDYTELTTQQIDALKLQIEKMEVAAKMQSKLNF